MARRLALGHIKSSRLAAQWRRAAPSPGGELLWPSCHMGVLCKHSGVYLDRQQIKVIHSTRQQIILPLEAAHN